MQQLTARSVLDSIKLHLNINTDKELAKEMSMEYGALTSALSRGTIQYHIIIPFLIEKEVDLNILSPSWIPTKRNGEEGCPVVVQMLEKKYFQYKNYVGTKVMNKLDEDIKALIGKYDDICNVIRKQID